MKAALCLGGNLFGSNPDAAFSARAISNLDFIAYLSTTLNTGHAWATARETVILPVLPRDEEPQATTQESMFSYVRLSDGGRARHAGPRSEVSLLAALGRRVLGEDGPVKWADLESHQQIRELIAGVIPGLEPLAEIDRTRQEFHIAGRRLEGRRFPTSSGKAKFQPVRLPELPPLAECQLRLMTIRSEGQFNTVVYEDEDLYRGQERRDVAGSAGDRARPRGHPRRPGGPAVRHPSRKRGDVLPRGQCAGPAHCRSAFEDAGVQVGARGDRCGASLGHSLRYSRRPVPGPPRKREAGGHVIGRPRVSGQGLGRPAKVRLERGAQAIVARKSGIVQGLREAGLRPLVHLPVLAVPGMHAHHAGLIAHGFRVVGRSAERLGPIGREAFGVLRMVAVRERVADDGISETSLVPRPGQVDEGLSSSRCFVDRLRRLRRLSHGAILG
jgi:hypothetical protein